MLETLNMATWHKIRKRPFLKISFLVFLKLGHISAANPFHVTDLFLDPWKHQKTFSFLMFEGDIEKTIVVKWDNYCFQFSKLKDY